MQAKRYSVLEAVANTFSAFLLSVAVYQWLLPSVWHLTVPLAQNVQITALFTALSLGRNYICRRIFNRSL